MQDVQSANSQAEACVRVQPGGVISIRSAVPIGQSTARQRAQQRATSLNSLACSYIHKVIMFSRLEWTSVPYCNAHAPLCGQQLVPGISAWQLWRGAAVV